MSDQIVQCSIRWGSNCPITKGAHACKTQLLFYSVTHAKHQCYCGAKRP